VRVRVRLLLVLYAAAIAAAAGAALLVFGGPLVARRALGPMAFAAAVAVTAAVAFAAGAFLLIRGVARPLDALLAAAERLGATTMAELPPLGHSGEAPSSSLRRVALAFERVASAFVAERAELAARVAELDAVNRRLADTRDDLLRTERLATVGRLSSGIAHEVGNPLGAIVGYADLAQARLREDPDRAAEYVARISAEAGRIDAIVRGLLDFARPSVPVLVDVDVRTALDAAVRLARVQPRFREVAVEVALDAASLRVIADERQLTQVFLNLLLNAADAMQGSGRVTVSARARAGEGTPRVEIEVADTGPGFAPDHLSRVFEPFFTTKEPGQGTGLGLSVCHGIVASFGGRLSAANAPGGGAALCIELRASAPERA
jgi:two-component system NtrC family sensor kinase